MKKVTILDGQWRCPECGYLNDIMPLGIDNPWRRGDTVRCENPTPLLNGKPDYRGVSCGEHCVVDSINNPSIDVKCTKKINKALKNLYLRSGRIPERIVITIKTSGLNNTKEISTKLHFKGDLSTDVTKDKPKSSVYNMGESELIHHGNGEFTIKPTNESYASVDFKLRKDETKS